jgi:hypothetical protein
LSAVSLSLFQRNGGGIDGFLPYRYPISHGRGRVMWRHWGAAAALFSLRTNRLVVES